MSIVRNGMLVYIPHILEQFINKLDLDGKQERVLSVEEFKHHIAYFRLHPDEWRKILDDLVSMGVIEDYQNGKQKIIFR